MKRFAAFLLGMTVGLLLFFLFFQSIPETYHFLYEAF